MKKHLLAIEIAKNIGLLQHYDGTTNNVIPFPDKHWKLFEECQPLVYWPWQDEERRVIPTHDNEKCGLAAAPFKCFSIEVMGKNAVAKMPVGGALATIHYIMCVERGPLDFDFLAVIDFPGARSSSLVPLAAGIIGTTVAEYIDRIRWSALGSETTRVSVKIGLGKSKRQHRIRRIVHVRPKKYVEPKDGEKRTVDWSHRFNVRGHWRKMTDGGLGKDRNGDYCIDGYTWVVDHERGPEHLPLIKKTRLVDKSL